jgi:hypothetical protein
MKTECTLAEIIYIGLVAEKGRCYSTRWTNKYRKVIKLHISGLRKILYLFLDDSNIDNVLEEFRKICENETEIGKFYVNIAWREGVEWSDIKESHPKILRYMIQVLEEVDLEVNKIFVNKKKVYILLNTLHNLPRVFFDENEETLCNMRYSPISEDEALEYAVANMNLICQKRR